MKYGGIMALNPQNLKPWPKGVSGNPAGRPLGSISGAKKRIITPDGVLADLVKGKELAETTHAPSAYIRAVELEGKHIGMWPNILQVRRVLDEVEAQDVRRADVIKRVLVRLVPEHALEILHAIAAEGLADDEVEAMRQQMALPAAVEDVEVVEVEVEAEASGEARGE